MVILHTFLALTAGFAVVILLLMALTALVARLVPSWTGAESKEQPSSSAAALGRAGGQPGYAFVSLGSSFLASAAGGYVTAWIAAANPLIHVLALALVVLALAALSALQARGRQPIWYQLTLVALSPIGVLAGGLVRLRVLGIL
jgi:NADH:ubiquinone oxidoreductase subunit 6 (subunit J)